MKKELHYGMDNPPNWFPRFMCDRQYMKDGWKMAKDMALEIEDEDIRKIVLDNLWFPTMPVKNVQEMISNAVRQWNYTEQGWNWWRDLFNKYNPYTSKQMRGIYESDAIPYTAAGIERGMITDDIEPVKIISGGNHRNGGKSFPGRY